MVLDIEFPNGPWRKLFYGQYDEFSLAIYFNQDGFIISEILNNDKTKSVLSISQIMGVFGDAETFVETIPRNAIFLLQHGSKSNEKYILLLGEQEVLNYNQKDIADFVNDQFKKLQKDSKGIINIASSYEINLKAYSELSPEMRNDIFTNPLNIFSFIARNKFAKTNNVVTEKPELIKQEMFLGFYKATNEKATEPLDLFYRSFIFGESEKTLRVLLEDFAINKINTVIFTYDDKITNIKYPNENAEVQEKNKSTPVGFPLVNYNVGEKISVNLQDLPSNAFQELLGIKLPIVSELIGLILKEKQSNTLDNLIKDISEYPASDKFTSYNINLAVRIVNLIKQEYPGIFLGDFSVSDFFKDFGKNFGTINVVVLKKDSPLINKLSVYNTLLKIIALNGKENKIAIVLPNLQEFFSRNDTDILSKEFSNLIINDTTNYYLFTSKTESDLDAKLLASSTTRLSVLEDNEVGIILKDAKPFRFVLRPTYSKI